MNCHDHLVLSVIQYPCCCWWKICFRRKTTHIFSFAMWKSWYYIIYLPGDCQGFLTRQYYMTISHRIRGTGMCTYIWLVLMVPLGSIYHTYLPTYVPTYLPTYLPTYIHPMGHDFLYLLALLLSFTSSSASRSIAIRCMARFFGDLWSFSVRVGEVTHWKGLRNGYSINWEFSRLVYI